MTTSAEADDAESTTGSTSHRSAATPGHSAAAAALASLTPSSNRVSRSNAPASPARPSVAISGLLTPQRPQRSTSSASVVSTVSASVIQGAGSITSSQELIAKGDEEHRADDARSTAIVADTEAPAPSISIDLSDFPPARPSPTKKRQGKVRRGEEDATDEESQDGEATIRRRPADTPQRPVSGVDFLTRRLRSAIGQDLLEDDSESGEDANAAEAASRDSRMKNTTLHPQQKQTAAIRSSSVSTESGGGDDGGGWGWSTFTTLPASLRIENALQTLSFASGSGSSNGNKEADPARSEAKTRSSSLPDPGSSSTDSSMPNYIAALDVRKWFGGPASSAPEGQNRAAASSSPPPSLPKRLPVGSFPSPNVARRAKKESHLKVAQENSAAAAQKERRQVGADVEEHDLTGQTFGLASAVQAEVDEHGEEYDGDERTSASASSVFPPHEYLVLSTAGKPVYWSKASKARLVRARVTRQRKRALQGDLERRRAEGVDTRNEAHDIEVREETLAREEQDQQNEEDQTEATRVGLLQAIISNYAETDREKLHTTANEALRLPDTGRVCFLLRPPLYLVAVARWSEAESTLRNHLEYLYQAIISLVSATKLNRLFDRAANFDLKRLLQGTDNILDALLTRLQGETIAMRGALQPLRLDAALRHDVGAALIPARNRNSRPQDALYALLLTRKGIITLARRRKHSIHPIDCHLLVNTVLATKALKEGGTQSWVPICLPKFAPQGFVYAHVSFLVADPAPSSSSSTVRPELGLVLVTGNPDGFDDMSAWRERIVGLLQQEKLLRKLLQTTRTFLADPQQQQDTQDKEGAAAFPASSSPTVLTAGYSADELGLPGLRHFCFKWRSNVQSTSPTYEEPYVDGTLDHQRLVYLYGLAHEHVVRSGKAAAAAAAALKPTAAGQDGAGENGSGVQSDADTPTTRDDAASETDVSSRASTVESRRKAAAEETSRRVVLRRPASPGVIVPRSVLATGTTAGRALANAASAASSALSMSASSTTATCMHLVRTDTEAVFAWSTPPFELYLCASPHIPRTALVNMAKAVVKWVKQEEHRLFIVSAPVF